MYRIRIDRIGKLLEQRVTGTPDVAETEASGAAMRQAALTLGLGPEEHVTLYDLSEMGLVGDDVIASTFRQFNDPRFSCVRARKVAVVIGSALLRMKVAGPSETRPNMRVFADRADAMRWLFAS